MGDDSPSSLKAIRYGYELAAKLNAKVALAGVVDEALAEGNVDAGVFPDQAAHDLKKSTKDFLSHMKEDYGKDIDTEFFTPEGEVKETILNLAKEWEATLIVAGTHGRKGLNRLLMGSVAEGILRDSNIPVMVVPMKI